jgi:hypothetical protein
MSTITFELDQRELAADKVAVAQINFCSVWPTAKPILQQLLTVVSSTIVKFAINTVIAAGNAYCGSSSGADRLARFGLSVPANAPPGAEAFLLQLSDAELTTLASVQRQARLSVNTASDVGSGLF